MILADAVVVDTEHRLTDSNASMFGHFYSRSSSVFCVEHLRGIHLQKVDDAVNGRLT